MLTSRGETSTAPPVPLVRNAIVCASFVPLYQSEVTIAGFIDPLLLDEELLLALLFAPCAAVLQFFCALELLLVHESLRLSAFPFAAAICAAPASSATKLL